MVPWTDIANWDIEKDEVASWQRETDVLVTTIRYGGDQFEVRFQLPVLKKLGDVDHLRSLLPELAERSGLNQTDPTLASSQIATTEDTPEQSNVEAALDQLERLRARGLVTDEEYQAKRADILSRL